MRILRTIAATITAGLALTLGLTQPASADSMACSSCLKIRNSTTSHFDLYVAKDGPYTLADSRTPKGTLDQGQTTSGYYLYWPDAGGFFLYPGQIAWVRNEATGVTTGPIESDGWKRLKDEHVTKTVTIIS